MVDYSKWKDIEVSDDEDDTHPNIDTASLHRWRHQARIERMAEHEKKKNSLEKAKKEQQKKMEELRSKLESADISVKTEVEKSLASLEKEKKKIEEKEKELEKEEKLQPWNVDTISKEGFSKTLINTAEPPKRKELTEEERENEMRDFIKKYRKDIEKYGMFRHYDDSREYLQANPHLACEYTANYLVVWCIDLEMEEKHTLAEHVAHQVICMQFILELSKTMNRNPSVCVSAFFHRIKNPEPQYQVAFNDELESFRKRIRTRAAQKLDEAHRELEEEERQKRLGPGGLDPLEVLPTLPEDLQACFESKDIQQLQDVISKMDPKDAAHHMKRCVDSGLWVPDANVDLGGDKEEEPEEEEEQTESVYDTVD